jgi:hypothetical protein
MDEALRLHTFARRTCMTRFDHWAESYGKLAASGGDRIGSDYTDDAYAIFPRYNVLKTVLDGIEAIDADALPAFEQLRSLLAETARTASSDVTTPMSNAIHQRAMSEERETLAALFAKVTALELADVEPLFYRRTLDPDTVRFWRQSIAMTWGAPDGYWYPLGDKTHPSLVALGLHGIGEIALQERIGRFFSDNAVARVIELREFGEGYELDASAAVLSYTDGEGFWTAAGGDWIVYCSHEGTITFGGKIADEIGPEYRAHHYEPSQPPHWLAGRH